LPAIEPAHVLQVKYVAVSITFASSYSKQIDGSLIYLPAIRQSPLLPEAPWILTPVTAVII